MCVLFFYHNSHTCHSLSSRSVAYGTRDPSFVGCLSIYLPMGCLCSPGASIRKAYRDCISWVLECLFLLILELQFSQVQHSWVNTFFPWGFGKWMVLRAGPIFSWIPKEVFSWKINTFTSMCLSIDHFIIFLGPQSTLSIYRFNLPFISGRFS